MTVHLIHTRSLHTFLADVVFFLGMCAPRNWRERYEYHTADCGLFFNGVECTCSRTGGAA